MLDCSGLDDAAEEDVAPGLEGSVAPPLRRSSLLGVWTALVVTIVPHANPNAIAAKAVPMPAK
jgi:hypothetical protein